MGLIVEDALGKWNQLGSIRPIQFNEWYRLGEPHVQTSGTYRLTFESNNFPQVRSFAWLRAVYSQGGLSLVSQAIRIYPKPQQLKIHFPISESLLQVGITEQQFELKKIKRRYSSDWIWGVGIEELVLENQSTKNTFLLILENVRYTQDPENPGFWLSIFEEPLSFAQYEVGRFYRVADDSVYSDPLIDKQPYLLRCVFTSNSSDTVIQPGTLKARIIY